MWAVREELKRQFSDAVEGFGVAEIREDERPFLIYKFGLCDYWRLSFVYDRGLFGFDIDHGEYTSPVLSSFEGGWSLQRLDLVIAELDRRVRLRIPDKYLEWYTGGKPPAT